MLVIDKKTLEKALELDLVLAYYETPDSEPLILDNLIAAIRPTSKSPDLLPIYSFNGNDLWMSEQRGRSQVIRGGSLRINLWRDLNVRLKNERNLGSSYTTDKIAPANVK